MTPDELETLLRNEPAETVTAALLPLASTEDKKLAKATLAIKRLAKEEITAIYQSRRSYSSEDKDIRKASSFEARVQLAILAFCSWSETRKVPSHLSTWGSEKYGSLIYQILKARKPDWLERWVVKELESRWNFLTDWDVLRTLIREGLCPKPASENYILQMLRGMYISDRTKSLKDRLLEDPALLEDEIWKIFELSPIRETILHSMDLTWVARKDYPCFSWAHTLRELSTEGRLDRQRLLNASLGSLKRNTEARNTTWFCKFHELLEPTDVEWQALQPSYLQLLGHSVPAVIGLALDALAGLEKAGTLDVPGFLDAVAPVFFLKPKAQPLAALKILRRISAAGHQHVPKMAEVLLAGLTHSAVQVQQGILDILARASAQAAEVIAAALPERIDQLAPSVQESARQLLRRDVAVSADVAADQAHQSAEANFDELIAAARAVVAPWRDAAGIDALLQAIEGGGELEPPRFDAMGVPRLDPEKRLAPIASLDELIQRLTVAVEGLDDPIEFELLADGLSRLCDQRPDDFEARVAPLLHRLRQIISPHPRSLPAGISLTAAALGLRAFVFKLILRWCEQDLPGEKPMSEDRNDIVGFLTLRMDLLSVRLRKRLAAPLLACPTHRPAWIDPAEMARRLAWHQDQGIEPSPHDFIQAMLRIAPDGRATTLATARDLQGRFAAAFRYGLGGPLEDVALPQSWLIAAGRARAPFAELTELDAGADALGPDARQPARYEWRVEQSRPESQKHWARLYVSTQINLPARDKIGDVPTVLLHAGRNSRGFDWPGGGINGLNRWEATVWPANLDSFFMTGASLCPGSYFEAATLRQRAAYLEPLFDPDVPFSEMAQLLVAQSLLQKEPEVAGLAADALIELIRDGRCTGSELGYFLGRMVPTVLVKLNRLGKQLEACAAASLLHKHVCARIAQDACAGLTEIPKDLHTLLGPLLEWLTALDQGVRAELRPLLEKAKSGKTALLAKRLLARTSSAGKCRQVFAEALAGRLDRAGRWSSAGHGPVRRCD